MRIEYEQLFSRFRLSITEGSFDSYTDELIFELEKGWLHNAVANPRLKRCFTQIRLIEDEENFVELTVRNPSNNDDEEEDREWAEGLLALAMRISWLEPYVYNTATLAQMFGGKEEKFYSQAMHLAEMSTLLQDAKSALYKRIKDRNYLINDYLNDAM